MSDDAQVERELNLLAILAGCSYFNLRATAEGLIVALIELRGPDPLFGHTGNDLAPLLADLNQTLTSLVNQGYLQAEDGAFRYYSPTEVGLQKAKELKVPVSLMNLPAMTAFAMRGWRAVNAISTTKAAA